MKIAICVSGLLRMLEPSFKSIYLNLMEDFDADLFIDTWENEESFVDDKWGINDSKAETNELAEEYYLNRIDNDAIVKQIENICPITKIRFEKQSEVEELESIQKMLVKTGYLKRWSPVNYSCHIYKLHGCNELKKEFEQEHDFIYDAVIRCRTELKFDRKLVTDDLEKIQEDENVVMIPKGRDFSGINDQFAIGSSSAINKYTNLKNCISKGLNPHVLMKTHLLNSKLSIVRFSFPYELRNIKDKSRKKK